MKKDYLNQPILITGIERSGSTIIAKVLAMCDVFMGDTTEMGENKVIKSLVNDFYTSVLKVPINGQKIIPSLDDSCIPSTWAFIINDILEEQKYKEDKPWIYKSSRIAQIWQLWNETYPDAKWIIVRRRTGDIVQSCLKTGFMTGYSDAEGWLGWIHKHEALFLAMIKAGVNYKEVYPERMAQNDFSQIKEVITWLGLEWNADIPKVVNALLKNSPQKERN